MFCFRAARQKVTGSNPLAFACSSMPWFRLYSFLFVCFVCLCLSPKGKDIYVGPDVSWCGVSELSIWTRTGGRQCLSHCTCSERSGVKEWRLCRFFGYSTETSLSSLCDFCLRSVIHTRAAQSSRKKNDLAVSSLTPHAGGLKSVSWSAGWCNSKRSPGIINIFM